MATQLGKFKGTISSDGSNDPIIVELVNTYSMPLSFTKVENDSKYNIIGEDAFNGVVLVKEKKRYLDFPEADLCKMDISKVNANTLHIVVDDISFLDGIYLEFETWSV